ncbi:MAG: GNAT family N-acetyltransferase [Candidatus Moraniibacteriota bacterium]
MIKLFRATIEDANVLLEIERTTEGLGVYSGYYTQEEIINWIKTEIVFIIKKDDLVAGSISYEIKDKNHVYISGLVVRPEFQKMGIAREAMNLLLDKFGDVKRFSLVVHPDNHAVKLYESLGFSRESVVENYFGDGEPRMIMVKNK